jgi:tellurite resistance protein
MVLGIAGLASAWRAAARLWDVPALPGEAIAALAMLVWLAWLALYGAKWASLPAQAREELRHPVQGGFLMMIPASTQRYRNSHQRID